MPTPTCPGLASTLNRSVLVTPCPEIRASLSESPKLAIKPLSTRKGRFVGKTTLSSDRAFSNTLDVLYQSMVPSAVAASAFPLALSPIDRELVPPRMTSRARLVLLVLFPIEIAAAVALPVHQ